MKTILAIFISAILFGCTPKFTELNNHGFDGGFGGSSKFTESNKVELVEKKNQNQISANLPVSEIQLIQNGNIPNQVFSNSMTEEKTESVTLLKSLKSKVRGSSNFKIIPKITDQKLAIKKTNSLSTKAKIWIGAVTLILTILLLLIIAGLNAMGGAPAH